MNEVASCTLDDLIRQNQVKLTKGQNVYLKVKRVLDFICALLAMVVLSPVFLIVAIIIKLDSPKESIIFKQERIGQNGNPFMLYKFRSMKQGTPELGTSEFMDAEKYITKVGKFIRKTSLDELPQLWCVICGDMSLVGERPLLAREESMHFLRNYYGIYQVKPGITGLAQINGRDNIDDYDKVRWDRAYVHNVSLALDVKILWQTVAKVLQHDGVVDDIAEKEKLAKGNALVGEAAYEHTAKVYEDEILTRI